MNKSIIQNRLMAKHPELHRLDDRDLAYLVGFVSKEIRRSRNLVPLPGGELVDIESWKKHLTQAISGICPARTRLDTSHRILYAARLEDLFKEYGFNIEFIMTPALYRAGFNLGHKNALLNNEFSMGCKLFPSSFSPFYDSDYLYIGQRETFCSYTGLTRRSRFFSGVYDEVRDSHKGFKEIDKNLCIYQLNCYSWEGLINIYEDLRKADPDHIAEFLTRFDLGLVRTPCIGASPEIITLLTPLEKGYYQNIEISLDKADPQWKHDKGEWFSHTLVNGVIVPVQNRLIS
jgi:hypothetical protein